MSNSNSYDGPSKSQRKRDMDALQKMGETLVKLPLAQLNTIPLTERLLEAIMEARSLKAHGAIRRQLQFIGRLMRDIDAEPIEEALNQIRRKDQHSTAKFHQVERWRTKLIADEKQLADFLKQYPAADQKNLQQLIQKAQKQVKGSETELFRYLRLIIE